jgi:hypothetical protein
VTGKPAPPLPAETPAAGKGGVPEKNPLLSWRREGKREGDSSPAHPSSCRAFFALVQSEKEEAPSSAPRRPGPGRRPRGPLWRVVCHVRANSSSSYISHIDIRTRHNTSQIVATKASSSSSSTRTQHTTNNEKEQERTRGGRKQTRRPRADDEEFYLQVAGHESARALMTRQMAKVPITLSKQAMHACLVTLEDNCAPRSSS